MSKRPTPNHYAVVSLMSLMSRGGALPASVLINLFTHLGPREFGALLQTCDSVACALQAPEGDLLWKLFCSSRWPSVRGVHFSSYREHYKQRILDLRGIKKYTLEDFELAVDITIHEGGFLPGIVDDCGQPQRPGGAVSRPIADILKGGAFPDSQKPGA